MNTFSLSQVSKTGSNLTLRQYKSDLMSMFMQIKSNNPKMTQKKITKELCYSDSTKSRYRKDVKMTSPYKSTTPRHKNVQDRRNTSKHIKMRQIDAQNNDENHQILVKNSGKHPKNKQKCEITGGASNHYTRISGEELIKHDFS